ncbi:MAG TPA: family 1 glycosylhydrolase [Candidatus Melainabacteria bacterium]|nr:family 1 glycosylhydrolase [Candidatus Melainabacteria bacterium]
MTDNSANIIKFPEDFLWGVSASHFQIEGYPTEVERRLSDWSRWTEEEGRILDGSNADRACEFHKRYLDDIELIGELNLKAYRTSLNWAALMPEGPGTVSRERQFAPGVVEYYRDLFSRLKERGIKVFVTLFHFCLPDWLAEEGGWTSPRVADEFETFADLARQHFGDLVDYWMTVNEPMAYIYQGYVAGNWPPGASQDYLGAFVAIRSMLTAHARAYHALKGGEDAVQVSFANHWRPFAPERKWSPLDLMVTHYRERVFNHIFPESIDEGALNIPAPLSGRKEFRALEGEIPGLKKSMDFLAVNYYTRELSRFDLSWPPDLFGTRSKRADYPVNGLGWEVYPEGFYRVLTSDINPYLIDSKGHNRPVFVTENGFATLFSPDLSAGDWSISDRERCDYLISHLVVLKKAIEAGVNIKGYLHWSLTDNFEWSEGLTPRFGLVRVSYEDQARKLRESAELYSKIAAANALETIDR